MLVRLRLLDQLQRGVRWTVASTDSWYHVRRAAWGAAHGTLPHFDPWLHHPQGNWVVWPDGFDGLIALLTRWQGPAADPDHAIVAGIVVVTLAAVLTALLAAEVAARLAPRVDGHADPGVAALVAGLAVAVHGGLHNYTQAGKIDHHAVEPLLTCAAVACLLGAVRPVRAPRRWWLALAAGLSLGLVQAMLPSSAMTIGVVAAAAAVAWLSAADHTAAARPLAAAFGFAACAGVIAAATAPAAVRGGWAAERLTWLQPTLCATVAVAFGVAGQTPRRWAPWLWLAVVVVPLLVLPATREALLAGGGFVGGKGYVAVIAESASARERGWSGTLAQLGALTLTLPWLALWWWRRGRDSADVRVWLALALVGALLALLQARFATLAALPVAMLFAAAVAGQTARRGPRQTLLVAGLCLLPGLWDVTTRPLPAAARRIAVVQALDWLHGHAALPGDPWDPASRPTFAVLAPWALGHDLLLHGGQANVCSPMIAKGQTEGLDDCLRMHLGQGGADDPTALLALKHQVRWWLTVPLSTTAMRAYAEAVGEPADRYAGAQSDGSWAVTPAGNCTNAQVLFHAHGSAAPDGSCQARPDWRLAFVAADGRAKLFERVAGARLLGQGCPAGQPVQFTARLDVAGQGVKWLQRTVADSQGAWRMRVPWSSGYATSTVRLLDMQVDCGKPYPIRIDERAVRRGVAVAALPADATAAALPEQATPVEDGAGYPRATGHGHDHSHGVPW